MAEAAEKDDFEIEIEENETKQVIESKGKKPEDDDIEVVDDTPEQDRGRQPMPQELVDELENDELDEYSDKVKTRLKQMKKVWHDERREKERAYREQQEAIALAQKVVEENKKLKQTLTVGERDLLAQYQQSAELQMAAAERMYRDAYESGDTDRVVEAQRKLNEAAYLKQQIANYRPAYALQEGNNEVNVPQQNVQRPVLDAKTKAWQERNTWWGTDSEMTATALGLHQKLERERGAGFIGTDEYWQSIDSTMKRRYPEYFGNETEDGGGKPVNNSDRKPATVVAPASRSRSAKKIVLKQSQLAIAKKLGLTPEQYAREYAKTLQQ